MRFSSVVLPLPRNPVRIVTGTIFSSEGVCCAMPAPCEGPDYKSGAEPDSGFQDEQSFEVLALRKREGDGVIRGGGESVDDLCLGAGVERGAGDDRLEQPGGHAARARERGEEAAGREELQRPEVDVLVGARGLLHLRSGGREFRRIEDDEVEARRAVAQLAQLGEDVGLAKFDARSIERVRGEVLASDVERGRGALDGGDALRAPGERGDRETAGVAEDVQYLAAGGERAHARSVFTLVEEEPGLLALLDVDTEVKSVFDDRAARRVPVAAREASARFEPFELAHLRIRALVDRGAAR